MTQVTADNPLGILAIDHLEFTCDNLNSPTQEIFYKMGLGKTFIHEESISELYSEGQVRFLLTANNDPNSHSRKYFKKHGEGVSKISFLVESAERAVWEAHKRGAKVIQNLKEEKTEQGIFKAGTIQGFGDLQNEFVERPAEYFRPQFTMIKTDPKKRPLKQRVARIDHLTNNVPKEELRKWVKFYTNIFGMKVTRYFDIKGAKTGLESEVVQLANGQIIIPINGPSDNSGKSQIQEFLDLHKGPGVQHIALTTANILDTVDDLRERGMNFLKIPKTYYQDIPSRNLPIKEKIEDLERLQLLVDGDENGYLLQNFSDTYVGPLFFEFIERHNHNGFGEGNFKALFEAIERDQIERGYLKV